MQFLLLSLDFAGPEYEKTKYVTNYQSSQYNENCSCFTTLGLKGINMSNVLNLRS